MTDETRMIPVVEIIPVEEESTSQLDSSEKPVEDIRLDTHVGPLRLKAERGVKSYASFTPYSPAGDYSSPKVLANLARQLFGWGFQVSVGKPPISLWNASFKETDEYETLSEEKKKLRVTEAAKSMPSSGRYGRVDSFVEGFTLPRDFSRSFLSVPMPRAVMVQFNGENEVTACAMEYYSESKVVETHIEGEYVNETSVGIRVHAFTNLHCYTQKHYRALCDRILSRSWDDSVEVLLQMNEVESSVLIDDSQEEISLD